MIAEYKLRCSVYGHTSDVRALACLNGGGFVSGSRDKTLLVWQPKMPSCRTFQQVQCLKKISHYVSCLCTLPPSDQHPSGVILAGSNDNAIYGFTLKSEEPFAKFIGHSDTVCALAPVNSETFVSGSWDKTARIWYERECIVVLDGHQQAVWAVEILASRDLILTGSADTTIRMWLEGKTVRTFEGHEQSVRGLAVMSETKFLSCSNDQTVRLWQVDGECLAVYVGHDNFIYSISALNIADDSFVTSSEDSTVKIWMGGVCVQTIKLPSLSLWTVACLENGDVAVGGSDKTVRVFTRHKDLMAPESEILMFKSECNQESSATSDKKPSGGLINIDDLGGREVLQNPGSYDGQTLMCKEGDGACAYGWSEGAREWVKIGDVISKCDDNNTGHSRGVMFEGRRYDHVFDVEVGQNNEFRKLPYNVGDDPWIAAQNFITRYGLSQEFLATISTFITANTVESTGPKPQDNGDEPSRTEYFPLKSYVTFDVANADGLRRKLQEFSERVSPSQKLSQDEVRGLLLLTDNPSTVTDGQMSSLEKIMNWPDQFVFPALDLFRLAVRSPVMGKKVEDVGSQIVIGYLIRYLVSADNPVNSMLSARTFCNLFSHAFGKNLLGENAEKICSVAVSCVPSEDQKVEVAVATLFMNFSVAIYESSIPFKQAVVDGVMALTANLRDPEATYRLLICIGTLMGHEEASRVLKKQVRRFVMDAASRSGQGKVEACAKALMEKFYH